MASFQTRIRAVVVLAVFVFILGAGGLLGGPSEAAKAPSSTKKTQARRSAAKVSAKKSVKKTPRKKRRSRRPTTRARLAKFKMQPERASEIQQALISRGYLQQEPTGVWDDATRSAMKRFQEDFQFPATGYPEAKSLMKLGLGPHPLPEELDPEFQTREQAARLEDFEAGATDQPSGSQ